MAPEGRRGHYVSMFSVEHLTSRETDLHTKFLHFPPNPTCSNETLFDTPELSRAIIIASKDGKHIDHAYGGHHPSKSKSQQP